MRQQSLIAHHLVWTAYGTWLPNDPRGSGSLAVATPALAELGERHYGRRRVQPARHVVREFYDTAEERLRFSVIRFDVKQIVEIAVGFSDAIARHSYTCYACAILSDHVHLVVRKHRRRAETMIVDFQDSSFLRLAGARLVPIDHPVWTSGGWKTFLTTPSAVRSAIRYVENNPIKAGQRPQTWSFVKPYNGWPLHRDSP